MGIPRKGSRRITVDGKEYRYLIKETHVPDHKDQKKLCVTIQELVDCPGGVVQFIAAYGHPIGKRDIALNINNALKGGWNPSGKGRDFFAWEYAPIPEV